MNRIRTGFHRIGIVLSTPILALAISWAALEWNTHRHAYNLAEAKAQAIERAQERAAKAAELKPWEKYQLQAANPFEPFEAVRPANYVAPAALAGLAISLYFLCSAIGWIAVGFIGELKK